METPLPTEPPWYFDVATMPGWFDYVGLVLTLVGFGLAWMQLRKTRKAAVAATAALTDAQSKLSERAVFAIAPQLHHAHEDIQLAMKSGDGRDAQRALVRFARLADELGDVLIVNYGSHAQLAKDVHAAGQRATKVKVTIVTKPDTVVATALTPVFKDADAVVTAVDKMTAGMRNKLEGVQSV